MSSYIEKILDLFSTRQYLEKKILFILCFFSFSLPVVGCISVCEINQLGSLCIVIKCDSFHTFIQVNSVAEEWYLSYGRITASCASMTERFYSFTATSVSLNLTPAVRKLISLSETHTVFILCCDFIMRSNTTNWKKNELTSLTWWCFT